MASPTARNRPGGRGTTAADGDLAGKCDLVLFAGRGHPPTNRQSAVVPSGPERNYRPTYRHDTPRVEIPGRMIGSIVRKRIVLSSGHPGEYRLRSRPGLSGDRPFPRKANEHESAVYLSASSGRKEAANVTRGEFWMNPLDCCAKQGMFPPGR